MLRLPSPLVAAALTCALLSAPASAQDLVAIRAGTVHTLTGEPLKDAVVLIENGVIRAVGQDVEVPWNARVIEAKDGVVMPAYVLAHTIGGLSGSNENMENVPFLTVQDAIDPSSEFFDEALRNGIGTIHVIPGNRTLFGGQGMIVRPSGRTVEEMTVREHSGLKLSLEADRGTSRMAQIRKLRNVLKDAVDAKAELDRKRAEFDKEKEAGAIPADKEFDGKLDEQKQPILDLIEGRLPGYLFVPSAAEVPEVERLVREYPDMKLVLVLGPTCHKAADRIKALGLPVVLESNALEYEERDPETGDVSVLCPAKVFADAGIEFAISVSPGTSSAERFPWWQMAAMVRHGVDRATALRSLTTVPAKVLGLAAEFGTIEPGRVACLQVLTGDPLAATTWVETTLIEGEVVYERAKDARLKLLFGADGETAGEAK
ncbi:MAG: amidohydrolase family protein [Planctomycetes bacterium]|nr:amidohydrolase family protein [Planctomycetota bacterium]